MRQRKLKRAKSEQGPAQLQDLLLWKKLLRGDQLLLPAIQHAQLLQLARILHADIPQVTSGAESRATGHGACRPCHTRANGLRSASCSSSQGLQGVPQVTGDLPSHLIYEDLGPLAHVYTKQNSASNRHPSRIYRKESRLLRTCEQMSIQGKNVETVLLGRSTHLRSARADRFAICNELGSLKYGDVQKNGVMWPWHYRLVVPASTSPALRWSGTAPDLDLTVSRALR